MSAAVAAAEEQAEETITHGVNTIRVAASWRVGIGGKPWSTGALACTHLAAHAARYAALAPKRQLRILELGAGTGFGGLCAAALGAAAPSSIVALASTLSCSFRRDVAPSSTLLDVALEADELEAVAAELEAAKSGAADTDWCLATWAPAGCAYAVGGF